MLFGHQNDDNNQQPPIVGNDVQAVTSAPAVNPLAVDPDTGVSLPVAPEELSHENEGTATETSVLNQSASAGASDTADDTTSSDDGFGASTATPDSQADDVLHPSADDDLLHLKQQALEQLSPLVSHLEQTPEEQFRTTMMMIQSSDNQNLIKDAYAAAQKISDDKVRAQALLDIVNEINYFTQQGK